MCIFFVKEMSVGLRTRCGYAFCRDRQKSGTEGCYYKKRRVVMR